MEIHCLFCHKVIPQTPGKRQKNFCNTSCRSMYWQQNKRVPKTVQRVTYDKVVAENNALRDEVDRLTKELEFHKPSANVIPERLRENSKTKAEKSLGEAPKKPAGAPDFTKQDFDTAIANVPVLGFNEIKKMAEEGATKTDIELAILKAKPKLTPGQISLINSKIKTA